MNPWKFFLLCLVYLEHRNNIIYRNWNVQPAQIINLMVNLYDDMIYYNVMSRISGQDVVQIVI